MTIQNLKLEADAMDRDDPLAAFRDRFHIPSHGGREVVYLCGNSLGLAPKTAEAFVLKQLSDWRDHGVEGHFQAERPWVSFHEHFAEPLAELVGARPGEV